MNSVEHLVSVLASTSGETAEEMPKRRGGISIINTDVGLLDGAEAFLAVLDGTMRLLVFSLPCNKDMPGDRYRNLDIHSMTLKPLENKEKEKLMLHLARLPGGIGVVSPMEMLSNLEHRIIVQNIVKLNKNHDVYNPSSGSHERYKNSHIHKHLQRSPVELKFNVAPSKVREKLISMLCDLHLM